MKMEKTADATKGTYTSCLVFRGRWTIARGPSHTPFGGVRNLANTYRRCGANWAPPYNSYSHTRAAASFKLARLMLFSRRCMNFSARARKRATDIWQDRVA
eukprot:scaffold10870_cov117-Isochrysis_galbana.AAC.1